MVNKKPMTQMLGQIDKYLPLQIHLIPLLIVLNIIHNEVIRDFRHKFRIINGAVLFTRWVGVGWASHVLSKQLEFLSDFVVVVRVAIMFSTLVLGASLPPVDVARVVVH